MGIEDFVGTNKKLKNLTHIPDEMAQEAIRNKSKISFLEAEKVSVPVEKILGPDAREKVSQVKQFVIDRFAKRGIPDVTLPPIFFNEKSALREGRLGESSSEVVSLFNIDIKDLELKQLAMLKVLSHELYHGTAKDGYLLSGEGADLVFGQNVIGASVISKENVGNNERSYLGMLEEGAAKQFENETFEKDIQGMFDPKTVERFNQLVKNQFEIIKKDDPTAVEDDVLVTDEKLIDPDQISATRTSVQYGQSRELVEFLNKTIPNFFNVLEDARVHGKIMGLARAVEGRFGSGWYRKIATAQTPEASALLAELEKLG